jgi:uncharacterized SAM-binding protein YcdF (DUF218 family)
VAQAPQLNAPGGRRIVAVLGYSDRRSDGLHAVCASRLERAAAEATARDVVVLSGWARRRGRPSEAELMQSAWRGPSERVVCDHDARTTAENAAQVVAIVRDIGASEVLVVTSRWHARRAAAIFRVLLRGTGVRVAIAYPPEAWSAQRLLRELVRWPLMPVQALRARGGLSS